MDSDAVPMISSPRGLFLSLYRPSDARTQATKLARNYIAVISKLKER